MFNILHEEKGGLMKEVLYLVGNHSLRFRFRHYRNLSEEICERLNSIKFPNSEYLRLSKLNKIRFSREKARIVREINTIKEWSVVPEEFYLKSKNKIFLIQGPFGLKLLVNKDSVSYLGYTLSHWQWFFGYLWPGYNEMINEWRKCFFLVQKALGGNRVILTGDIGLKFRDSLTFNEYEQILKKNYLQKMSFFEETIDSKRSFIIDNFEGIDWNLQASTSQFLPEPDDKVDINFDLNNFTSIQTLRYGTYDDEIFLFKEIDSHTHYYHLLLYKGVLIKHTGVVGEIGKIDSSLDCYAPFTFDDLINHLINDGYYEKHEIDEYILLFRSEKYEYEWQEGLETLFHLLTWCGLGHYDHYFEDGILVKVFIHSQDEKHLIYYTRLIRQVFQIKEPMEIYKRENTCTERLIHTFEYQELLEDFEIFTLVKKDLINTVLSIRSEYV